MWGKADNIFFSVSDLGITPTHVGKRLLDMSLSSLMQDHPHPCGEKKRQNRFEMGRKGSPPPMWGKATTGVKLIAFVRITPTHVGKSGLVISMPQGD